MEKITKIKEIIAGVCSVPVEKVQLDSSIGEFPSWDSIGHLTILSTVENEFNINFEPEEMLDIESVSDILQMVEKKLQ